MLAASDQILQLQQQQQQQFPSMPIMAMDGRWRAHVQQAPNCPRCASTNTKFCYYNNYSLAQPRYFCKGCRRYWTKGGSLRNVPVGGGCRKSRRSRSSQAQRNNSADDKGYQHQTTTDSCSSSTGAEIDLAAVFARYLGHQEPAVPTHSVSEGEVEVEGFGSLISNSQITPLDGVFEQHVQLLSQSQETEQGQGQCSFQAAMDHQGGSNSGFVGHDDLNEMLFAEDVFWSTSDDGSSLSSNFPAWEPMASLEEFDSSQLTYTSVLDDQFRSTTNSLVSDANWSCFDLAGYGDLYRP